MPARNPKGVYVVALYSYRPSRKEKLELVKVYFKKSPLFFLRPVHVWCPHCFDVHTTYVVCSK